MNDDKKSMIVILGMVFLSLMIILPPLFRVLFPNDDYSQKKQIDQVKTLSCDRVISNSNYSTHVEVIYRNEGLEQNQITYTKIDDSSKAGATTGTLIPEEESSYLSKLNNINVTSDENTYVIILNKKSLEDNPNDQTLPKYLQSLSKQEQFYSELGYTCSVNTK